MMRSALLILLCGLLVWLPAFSQEVAEGDDPGSEGTTEELFSASQEEFRAQMLLFLYEMNDALGLAMQHPLVGEQLAAHLGPGSVGVPLSEDTYAFVKDATWEELENMRGAFSQVPELFAVPSMLSETIARLPATRVSVQTAASGCADEYTEFAGIQARTAVVHSLTTASSSLGLVISITKTALAIFGTTVTTCESPIDIPTSGAQIPFIIIVGVIELADLALNLAIDILNFEIGASQFCIDSCVGHGFTEHFFADTNSGLVGKGCDNRDNNCAIDIDEPTEDMVDPVITVDSALTTECYRREELALEAATLGIHATDDCYAIAPEPPQFAFNRAACVGFVSRVVQDGANNTASVGPIELTIDEIPPVIVVPPLLECYPSVDAVRDVLTSSAIIDCTEVTTGVSVIVNGCEAALEIEAVDECDNRTFAMANVRVDATPPEVNIESLLLPEVDGLTCFSSEDEAIATVAEATRFSDNCTSFEDLVHDTVASGDACNLEITSSAVDQCARSSSDSLLVRVDTEPPMLSCSVETGVLYPPDGELVDVGFVLVASDNCDGGNPVVEVTVTSDEPTAFVLSIHGTADPEPDAVIERGADGSVQRILLRSERRGTSAYDGRVYRIRVIATDSCGLSSRADCFVTVPRVFSNGTSKVINSGQIFDATETN